MMGVVSEMRWDEPNRDGATGRLIGRVDEWMFSFLVPVDGTNGW